MSVYQDKTSKLWIYDFQFKRRRYKLQYGLDTRAEATEAEAVMRRSLRRRAAGLEGWAADDTPSFSTWAAVTLQFQRERKQIKRPDQAKLTLRMILAFWGTKPKTNPVEGGRYHDLCLGHPIENPTLIHEFEMWMKERGLSGARKNHYRSACSMLYRVAMQPENRMRTGIKENPFRDIMRDRVRRRTRALDPDEIMKWIAVAPLPAVVAVAIGALAPALRLSNVVELRRDQLSPARDYLSVPHKTDQETGAPLTVAISGALRDILLEVQRQYPDDPYVVPMPSPRRRVAPKRPHDPDRSIHRYWPLVRLLEQSIKDAGLPYGRRRDDGVTFHSLRHAMHTWLARQGVPAATRQRAMGHSSIAMASWYTHLASADTVPTMELIGGLPIGATALARIKALAQAKVPAQPNRKKSPRIHLSKSQPTDDFEKAK